MIAIVPAAVLLMLVKFGPLTTLSICLMAYHKILEAQNEIPY